MSKRLGPYNNTKMRGSKPVDYYQWHRIEHHKPHTATREKIVKAFSQAWQKGHGFSITLSDYGEVRVSAGRMVVATYADAEAFARDFMPEVLKE